MSLLSKQEQLRRLLYEHQKRIRQTFPTHLSNAVLALTRAQDWHYLASHDTVHTPTRKTTPHTSYLYSSDWQKALQLCFSNAIESPYVSPFDADDTLDDWADHILFECHRLATGEQVLAYCENGYMKMQQGEQKDFYAWVASKQMPTEWREREDIDWWTNALTRTHEREMQELVAEKASIQHQLDTLASRWQPDEIVYRTTPEIDDYYHRLGMLHVKSMACHFLYPAHTLIGGCTVELYSTVLATLIGYALKHLDLCRAFVVQHSSCSLRTLLVPPQSTATLIEALSETLRVESSTVHRVVNAYSFSYENVLYHRSVVDVPAPPLLRLNEQHLVWSLTGLLSEPFFFLARELKRRYSYEYNNASHVREEIFRQDLYQLFSDKRFVRSVGSVELKGVQGDLTTDVDALIFDRKTGVLALFELKSQDPFAYSRQERIRQRDYFYNASKQVLACVQWLNRNGANALLTRLNTERVKRLRVQKTYIFVLGRYLAHFFDGPAFDHRAAWGTWPQVLRLIQKTSSGVEEANPIQSLHTKLMKDTPLALSGSLFDVQKIPIGDSTVYVYPDFQTYKSRV